jgi:hypothetical protein
MSKPMMFWGVLLFILLAAVACSPAAAPPAEGIPQTGEEEIEEPVEEPVAEVEETEASVEEEGTGGEEPAETAAEAGANTSDDFPIPAEAYSVDVTSNGRTVQYQFDGTIDDIVAFFEEELPATGWEMAGPQDTVVGSIASFLRKNAAGDQLTINVQENELGGFVRVTATVQRANP